MMCFFQLLMNYKKGDMKMAKAKLVYICGHTQIGESEKPIVWFSSCVCPECYHLEKCMNDVAFQCEVQGKHPFELLGRYVIRAEQDETFDKTMIEAAKRYITEIWNWKWN